MSKLSDFIDNLRTSLDGLGTEDGSEIDATADVAADEAAADELDTAEADELEPGTEAEADAAENTDGADETPGTESDNEETAEDDDLRAVITEQAAQIETYRNTLAAAGLEDPLEEAIDTEANLTTDNDTQTEEDTVAAFDEDYAKQEAMLAEIKEN